MLDMIKIPRPLSSYVYIHYLGDTPVYVGSGKEGRLLTNFSRRTQYDWDSYRLLADNLTPSEAKELEELVQITIDSSTLHNKMIGGKHSEETLKKMSLQKGWKHSEEAKAKMKAHWAKKRQHGTI